MKAIYSIIGIIRTITLLSFVMIGCLAHAADDGQIDISPTAVYITFIVVIVVIVIAVLLIINRFISQRIKRENALTSGKIRLMQQVLDISDPYVIHFDLEKRFVTNVHGDLLPTGGMSLDTFIARIHPDERDGFKVYFKNIIENRENLKRGETYRWNTSSDITPEYAYLYGRVILEKTRHKKNNLICAITDITEEIRREKEDRETTIKYTSIFDRSMVGLALYDDEGRLLDSNQSMHKILKYSDEKDEFWYNKNLYSLIYSDTGLTPEQIEDLAYCTLCERPERNVHEYLELRICPIKNDIGKLIYILVSARQITGERELYLQQRESNKKIREVSKDTAKYEDNLRYLLENGMTHIWRTSFESNKVTFYKSLHVQEKAITIDEFVACVVEEKDVDIARRFIAPQDSVVPMTVVLKMHNLIDEDDGNHWYSINRIPQYDDAGNQTGCFGLLRDITSLIEAQNNLREETMRANESEKQKSAFLANMSHEIRTPLNAIVGFSDLLPSIDDHNEKMELIRIIHKNSDLLIHLINDILIISTMDANGPTIVPRRIDFAKAFNDLCATLELQTADSPGVTFVKENPYKAFIVELDPDRVQQIIINFVTNAVKFTKVGYIKVGYRKQGDGIYLYCEDTGAGIPAEKCKDIFRRFVKLNTFAQGTGLGLNICKAIVDKCGGDIGVESEEGHGSTFHAWIPCPIIIAEGNDQKN